jgi:ribosomal protein L16/L10AE
MGIKRQREIGPWLKRRSLLQVSLGASQAQPGGPGGILFISLAGGRIARGTIAWAFKYLRRLSKKVKTRQPFWVRLYSSHAVTKKSQNSRMGKGKGSGAGSRGQIKPGSCLLRLYGWRKGLVRQVRRSVGVRFSVPM